jgi:hypothetical protein
MDIVYRIQGKDGRGPWRPGFSHKWVDPRDDHKNLKSWVEEFRSISLPSYPEAETHFACGCRTVEHLRRWFNTKEYRALLSHGYQAVALHAEKIIAESETQLVFMKHGPLNKGALPFALYD